jgi:TonB-linked SusC/RagA family outer membrane protein
LIILQAGATSFAQKIALSVKNAPISQVFEQIQNQCGYDFLYTSAIIKEAGPVSISVDGVDLKEVLKLIFNRQPLTYSVESKSVVVSAVKRTVIERLSSVMRNMISDIDIRGRVLDQDKNPLPGATISIKGTSRSTVTNDKGEFNLSGVNENSVLVISYIGYLTNEVPAKSASGDLKLKAAEYKLEEVNLTVSTGYQSLSKERSTGSFTQVNKALINRSVGTNILARMDGVTSGIGFTKTANKVNFGPSVNGGDPGISVRGRSTLFSNTEPLVVLDNFPYDGNLDNINPNDVESVTVLKDAAAASIWGVRAANGVIVITTKKGTRNHSPAISFKSDLTIAGKPDIYKLPQLTSLEFIELEKLNFENGVYDFNLNYAPFNIQTPAVDILEDARNGIISAEAAADKLEALSKVDWREDYTRYFLRRSANQQYAMSIKGGSANNQYYISGGYDKNLYSSISDKYNRFNLTANNTFYLLSDKLSLTTKYHFTKSETRKNSSAFQSPSYPYTMLADITGRGLPIYVDFRQKTKNELSNKGLLDWNYYPYNERKNDNNRSALTDNLINIQASYKLVPDKLDIDLNYQFQQGNTNNNVLSDISTYAARLKINQYSQTDTYGVITYPVPMGGLYNITNNRYKSNSARLQFNYKQTLSEKHELAAVGGIEVKDYNSFSEYRFLYGYKEDSATDYPVNYFSEYPQRIGFLTAPIGYQNSQFASVDRFFSYFTNASYSYDERYTFSTSIRKDESNLFGVNANQKGIPLYSLGLSWNINKESFYRSSFLPYLRLRITDGYNGNLNKNLSAYTTAQNAGLSPDYAAPKQSIVNPPNPDLRWERVHVRNVGLDFGFSNNLLSGSIDVYSKNGSDLIGSSPVAPQTGVIQFNGNTASVLTKGIDVLLSITNIRGEFSWSTNLLFNYVKDKITDYKMSRGTNGSYVSSNYSSPFVGKPYSAMFAFPWAGLDAKGNPIGILDGVESMDYGAILSSTNNASLKYMGTVTPTIFGSLRNNVSYKNIDLSFNITYKIGYYFRRGSFNSDGSYSQADYNKRWQKPGDELVTNVPSIVYPSDGQRETFFNSSEVLVEKGDHIRLQDVQLSYTLHKDNSRIGFNTLKFYGYMNNLGIIWRANKLEIDPDYSGSGSFFQPPPRSIALGLMINF